MSMSAHAGVQQQQDYRAPDMDPFLRITTPDVEMDMMSHPLDNNSHNHHNSNHARTSSRPQQPAATRNYSSHQNNNYFASGCYTFAPPGGATKDGTFTDLLWDFMGFLPRDTDPQLPPPQLSARASYAPIQSKAVSGHMSGGVPAAHASAHSAASSHSMGCTNQVVS